MPQLPFVFVFVVAERPLDYAPWKYYKGMFQADLDDVLRSLACFPLYC